MREVVTEPWAVLSRIECSNHDREAMYHHPIHGWWLATAMGLFRHGTEDPRNEHTPPKLTRSMLVARAAPAAMHVGGYMADSGSAEYLIESRGSAWCRTGTGMLGNYVIVEDACLEPGKGFVSGR